VTDIGLLTIVLTLLAIAGSTYANRKSLENMRDVLRAEMQASSASLRAEMASMRTGMQESSASLRVEMQALSASLGTRIQSLEAKMTLHEVEHHR
jgi:hypothetical protein